MRNYWLRIALGAVAIFTVGMIGVTLAKQGVGRVRGVVEGSGPLTIPLAFVPFELNGSKLGTVDKVVLFREAPKRISAVEIHIKLKDSLLAGGLEGCRLAANMDKGSDGRGVQIRSGQFSRGVFSCLSSDNSAPAFREFGRAFFQPGGVSVPLFLPSDMVDDLKKGDFNSTDEDSATMAQDRIDSIQDAVEARADSISAAAEARADSIMARSDRLADSLRKEGQRRADSTRRALTRMADSARRR
jgi:hypothetical protein